MQGNSNLLKHTSGAAKTRPQSKTHSEAPDREAASRLHAGRDSGMSAGLGKKIEEMIPDYTSTASAQPVIIQTNLRAPRGLQTA